MADLCLSVAEMEFVLVLTIVLMIAFVLSASLLYLQRRAHRATLDQLAELKATRAQFLAFLDHIPASMYLQKLDGEIVYVNNVTAAQYGMDRDKVQGRHEREFHAAPFLAQLNYIDRQIIKTGTAFQQEAPNPTRGRHELVCRFPVFDDEGRVSHIGGFNLDIDEQVRARTDLDAARALLESIFESSPMPIGVYTPAGKPVMMNALGAAFHGRTRAEVPATPARELTKYWPEFLSVVVPATRKVAETKSAQIVQTFRQPPGNDAKRYFELTIFPVLDASGVMTEMGTIYRDLTAQLQAQQAQDALNQAEKLASLGSLLAGVSHELNNPLAAVIGQAAMLAEDVENTPHAARVEKIRRASERCAKIVQSFLSMARQKAPEYQPVSPNDLLRAAVDLTDFQMRASNVELVLDLDPHLPSIRADSDQLHQVIVNLLTNARQALEGSVGLRQITVRSIVEGGMVRLTVADTGQGIAPDVKLKIFDPFFTTKAAGAGTGLGLPYALGIVQAHGGTIQVDDTKTGTAFSVLLPIADVHAASAEPAVTAPPKSRARGTVLIIDDEEEVADTLADMLERMGLEVSIAIGGQAALDILAGETGYDLILSDVRMPDVDGPALHDWIKREAPDLMPRLAFITGDTLSRTASDFLERCGRPYLEKPFTPAALRALVARVMP